MITTRSNNWQTSGVFITVEGVHGCGKSTIIQLIRNDLQVLGVNCTVTNDQAGTPIGREIRKINLQSEYPVAPMTETFLFAAAKHQNLVDVIKPMLAANHVVICERYIDAFFAFQGYTRGISESLLECIHNAATEGIMPDFTILLDIDPLKALSRIDDNTKHRIEKENTDYHLKLRQGYLERAKKYPDRIKIYNTDSQVEQVFKNIWGDILALLRKKNVIR